MEKITIGQMSTLALQDVNIQKAGDSILISTDKVFAQIKDISEDTITIIYEPKEQENEKTT